MAPRNSSNGTQANERTPLLSDAQQVAQQAYPDLLHLAKVLGAVQAGKLPTNAQLGRAIDLLTSKNSILSPDKRKGEGKLSQAGQTLLGDLQDVLVKLKAWGAVKNNGDAVQELFFHGQRAVVDADADASLDLDIKKPASSTEIKQDAHSLADTFKTLAKLVLEQTKILSSEAQDAGAGLSGELVLLARDLLADAAEEVSSLADEASKELRPKEGEKGKVPTKEDLKAKGKQAQEKAEQEKDKGKQRLESEAGPAQERAEQVKDKAVDRLINVAQRIQKDPAYSKAANQLFGLLQKYYKRTAEAYEQSSADAKIDADVDANGETQKSIDAFKLLLGNLAGDDGKSVDTVIEKSQAVLNDIKSDEKLSKYVEDIDRFIKTLLNNSDYALSKAPKRDAGKLYDRGQELLKENAEWKKHSNELISELERFGKKIADDKEAKELAASVKNLNQDLAKTAKVGANMFKGQAGAIYRDAVNVVLPRVLSLLKEVPIPRTEYKSEDVEFVIDNFTISSVSFVPDNLIITNHSEFSASRIGKYNAKADIDASTRIRFDGLRFAAKDVSFWVRRPGAIILSEERGLLDFSLSGQGLSGDLSLALAVEDDSESYFKVVDSKVNLKNLSLSIHDNYHYILSAIFTPLLKTALKVSLQSVLSQQIAQSFEFLDWRAFDVRRRAVRYESQGYTGSQAYWQAVSEAPPSASSGPGVLSGLHATKKGFIRDDRGPHDAQIAIGGEQLLPGHSGPRSSLDRAANKANNLANEVDAKTKKAQKSLPSQQDAKRAQRDAEQLRGIVQEEFADAQRTADRQRDAEEDDQETWKSDVFDI